MILSLIGFAVLVVIAVFLTITAVQILVITTAFSGRTEPIGFVFLTLAAGFGWLAWKLAPFTITFGLA